MRRYLVYLLLVLIPGVIFFYWMTGKNKYASDENTLAKGKELFTRHCITCHGLEEDGFGPPLGGITNLLSEKALTNFVRNPSMAIASGEERARSLQIRYKQIMPSYAWMDKTEISAILSYIDHETELRHLEAFAPNKDSAQTGLTGKLAAPVKKSALKIEMEEIVQIPKTKDSSPDLGIVTLRPHPSGDGTLFVGDQTGFIYRIKDGKAEIFLDARAHIKDFQSGPGIATGVGSFDFHPDFLNNGLLYITHAETYKGQTADFQISDSLKSEVQWVLSEWKMDNVRDNVFKGTHRELLRLHAPTFAHGAQDIGFIPNVDKKDPDYGLLYLGYGDGGSNNIKLPELGHHLRSFLGAILRIDPRGNNSKNKKYGIPAGNPFVNESDPLTIREIYAYGFRNPHRLAWDHTNGNRMMVTDIGEANIEEINFVEKGGDYGWPIREGGYGIATTRDLKTVYALNARVEDFFKKPFAQYDHQVGYAISGGYVYEGDLTLLKNKYVFGDIVNGKLFYVNINPQMTDSTIYELTIVQNGKETDLKTMSQTKRLHLRIGYDRFTKELYVITKVDGKIRRISDVY